MEMKTEVECPPNFSWIIDGVLAALAFPSKQGHTQYLVDHGVEHLVSLTAERTPNPDHLQGLQWTHIPIHDFMPPTLNQIINFVDTVEQARQRNEAVACHCAMGHGRAGTMIACYLVKSNPDTFTPEEAIKEIRRLRPKSIETERQEEMVFQYAEHLKTDQPCFSGIGEQQDIKKRSRSTLHLHK
ncbi:dual specificity protein phosphatase 23-like [Lineus longissimus]|uniref:dual specificity protein phosphatase 23-like n=1 Tax=Lineus longissimus TaxID=88925 RepID=UPI002B4D6427